MIYTYEATQVELEDNEEYDDIIKRIHFTVTGVHPDGRTFSVSDVFQLSPGNVGYAGFTPIGNLTKADLAAWVERDISGTFFETQIKQQIEQGIRSQATPGARTVVL